MEHRDRLHRIFALKTTGSKIRRYKSRFLVLTFADTGEGKTDNDFGRGDEVEVGACEWLDRVRFIEMSVPPSRMLFRAFNL